MKIIQLSDASIKTWSGGNTTELFIFPDQSSFSEGNFELRISLATVEQSQTVFTPLPDTQRTLLVLEGTQLLEHQGHHTANLNGLEQDSFSGGWTTHCQGTSTNFNVMTKGSNRAEVTVKNLNAHQSIQVGAKNVLSFIYVVNGAIKYDQTTIRTKQAISFQNMEEFIAEKRTQIVVVSYPLKSEL
ncbi:MAG: HutD family protein [Crocinitomicaceae bacterium]